MSKDNEKFKKHEKNVKKKYPTIEDLMFNNEDAKRNHERKRKYKEKRKK